MEESNDRKEKRTLVSRIGRHFGRILAVESTVWILCVRHYIASFFLTMYLHTAPPVYIFDIGILFDLG